jgi:hypothetical protein
VDDAARTAEKLRGRGNDFVSVDDLAELQDRAALAEHLADKAAGRGGASLDELDAALDRIDAQTRA